MTTITYRGYEISEGPAYTLDSRWQYVHESYDGPEDRRAGMCETVEECRAEIDELEDE